MPKFNPDKIQLNLFVANHVSETFREEARKAGYGSRPSPFVAHLLRLHMGNLQSIMNRLQELLEKNPIQFDTAEQKFFAGQLIELLTKMVK